MKYKNIEVNWLGHSGFMILGSNKKIYIDPFKISDDLPDADIIFITHSHYDHCSIEDIRKIARDGTIIVCPADVSSKMSHVDKKVIINIAEIGSKFQISDISVWPIPAYNLTKPHHTKEEDWVGYIIEFEGVRIYHAGDTDLVPEMKQIPQLDIAMLPVGGTATMNAGEAAKAALLIKPKLVIPMHYGSVFGSKSDAEIFAKHCTAEGLDVKIMELEK
jgi:L-ascorbate metabolism protein UlaG (beta-lactamase superfamily)